MYVELEAVDDAADEVVDEIVGTTRYFTKENKDFKVEELSTFWELAILDFDDDLIEVEKEGRGNNEEDFLGIVSTFCSSISLSSTSTVGATFLFPASRDNFMPTFRQPSLCIRKTEREEERGERERERQRETERE